MTPAHDGWLGLILMDLLLISPMIAKIISGGQTGADRSTRLINSLLALEFIRAT